MKDIIYKKKKDTCKDTKCELMQKQLGVFSQDINLPNAVSRRLLLPQFEPNEALHIAPYCTGILLLMSC